MRVENENLRTFGISLDPHILLHQLCRIQVRRFHIGHAVYRIETADQILKIRQFFQRNICRRHSGCLRYLAFILPYKISIIVHLVFVLSLSSHQHLIGSLILHRRLRITFTSYIFTKREKIHRHPGDPFIYRSFIRLFFAACDPWKIHHFRMFLNFLRDLQLP